MAQAAGLLAVGALLLSMVVGLAPNLDTGLVEWGERIWPGYAQDLRDEPVAPTCEVEDLKRQAADCVPAVPTPAPTGDAFGGEDPFGGDPFAEDDPFGGGDPFAGPSEPSQSASRCPAVKALAARCEKRHQDHQEILTRITPGTRAWRAVETRVASLAAWPFWRQLLVLVLLGGALATTASRSHIALRTPRNRLEDALSQGAQLFAHALLGISAVADWKVQHASVAEVEDPALPVLWAVGFAALAMLNAWNLVRPPSFDRGEGSGVARALMVVPLYAWMVVITGLYFLLVEGHPSGQAIYLHKFVQHPSIYLGVGLYVLGGMLLTVTRLTRLGFRVIEPWKLPPSILAWLAGTASALPTAYTGASGIFVLAAGREIFATLRRAGASRRLALAATAMSGSLGVVLRPCLLVVLIAVLNKQVTTDELFSRGLMVFGLSAGIFLVAMLILGRGAWRPASPRQALPASARALVPLLPHVGVAVGVVVFYALVLHTRVSEHTAALVVPAVLLAVVVVDRWLERRERARGEAPSEDCGTRPGWVTLASVTSGHVGALLMLMAASVGLGGVVERAELMSAFGQQFGSPVVAMAVLLVFLVLIGMLMEPLGAVVLVSVSLAGLAYESGIAPAHFWMVVLVAFELGYLTPPVAMNHLLARQAIGREAEVEGEPASSFAGRYQHVLVPMAIMATTLLLVAFGPLLFA